MIKVSVVLPIYNVAKYLPKCLDSLINQTLKDIEIICVNDASPDNSLQVLQEYALKDNRIKIIDQPNSGPGVARNNGINAALGKYIAFVDPDDWVDLDMFEKMYNAAELNQADLVECGVITHDEKTGKTKTKIEQWDSHPFDLKENPLFLFSRITAGWSKLCLTKLIKDNNINFALGYCAEDQIFTLSTRISAQKILYMPEALYHYLIRSTSLTQKPLRRNLCVPEYCYDIEQVVKTSPIYANVKNHLCSHLAGLAQIHRNKSPKDCLEEYDNKCLQLFSDDTYYQYQELIKKNIWKDYFFSIKYKTKGTKKYKILTILGLKLKI